jgi:tartrate-resistant acid phosphatase type 5
LTEKTQISIKHGWLFVLCLWLAISGCSILTKANVPENTATITLVLPTITMQWTSTNTPVLTATQTPAIIPLPIDTATPTETSTPASVVRFAVIGDYGSGNENAGDVAALIKSWQPDLIITTGDNNYPMGEYETIDNRVGQFFSDYIYPYHGDYGKGGQENLFFPTLGNHDWMTDDAKPYFDYFTLPGNERYYDFTRGVVHFFAIDSDSNEPDGVGASTKQAQWLMQSLAAATEPWKIVYMHQPPYSSGKHGSIDWAQWPYRAWGATAVLCGHDHDYERLIIDDLPYFVNGLGGGAIYDFDAPLDGSQVRYNSDYGAMLVTAEAAQINFQFITRSGAVIDDYTITAPQ